MTPVYLSLQGFRVRFSIVGVKILRIRSDLFVSMICRGSRHEYRLMVSDYLPAIASSLSSELGGLLLTGHVRSSIETRKQAEPNESMAGSGRGNIYLGRSGLR